jgi:hypothetical protein
MKMKEKLYKEKVSENKLLNYTTISTKLKLIYRVFFCSILLSILSSSILFALFYSLSPSSPIPDWSPWF